MFKISEILETPISQILDFDKCSFVQHNYGSESIYSSKIENFYQENKEVTDQLIKPKTISSLF
ncbi:hypothetical protein [Riemerella columbipharyngis]|uniref:hypothetical protein n=1 Tax=Riemerella columbipharyngis TaxID=1071918 RepID=UPI001FDFD13B|nr:hypothetical protein [Riemerella columbipharyngis]